MTTRRPTPRSSGETASPPGPAARRQLRQAMWIFMAGQGLLVFDVRVGNLDVVHDAVGVAFILVALWKAAGLLRGSGRAPVAYAGVVVLAVWLASTALVEFAFPHAATVSAIKPAHLGLARAGHPAGLLLAAASVLSSVMFALALLWTTRRLRLHGAAVSWRTSARLLVFLSGPLLAVWLAVEVAMALTPLRPRHFMDEPQARLVVAVLVVGGLLPWAHTILSAIRTLRGMSRPTPRGKPGR